MNFTYNKIILYMLLIVSFIDITAARPILPHKVETSKQKLQPVFIDGARLKRQIVQPTWLNIDREPAVDPTVHVNPKALLETSEIRKAIQKAVDEDIFVVTSEEKGTSNDANEEPISTLPPSRKKDVMPTENTFPSWYTQMQRFWHNWAQSLFKGVRS